MSDDTKPVVEPLDSVKARRVIWVVLLLLAGLQAWTARFTSSPDGVSYLDLSDAIVTGQFGHIVNAYWSPFYPALIGILRVVLRAGPYWEFGVQHFANWLMFAASIVAYEYFLNALTAVAATWGRNELATTRGRVIAYVLFGVLSLMMTPLSLPTPDLLVTTASFMVFGALLSLRDDPRRARHAAVLGLALAMGSLSKSFVIPWSLTVLLVAWVACGWRPTSKAGVLWLVFVGPWCVALSANQGHLTFGDTGRLTYVWYVNRLESPSAKLMPHGAATRASDFALPGVAATPDARGTNPVWFDPARWYTGLSPRWNVSQQLVTFSELVSQAVSTLAPVVLVLWFALATATRSARALWWRRVWIIMVPALTALAAYSLVMVTTRYIAPFLVTILIAVWFILPWPSRLTPWRILAGLGPPLLVVMSTVGQGTTLTFVDAALAAVIVAWAFRRRGRIAMGLAGFGGATVTYVLVPPELRSIADLATILILAGYWIAGRYAIGRHEPRRFSRVVRNGLVISNGLLIGWVAVLKYATSVEPAPAVAGEPNLNWAIAERMRDEGFGPGLRIAILGSPFEAYWARTGRIQIVGVVPPPRVAAFRTLSPIKRDLLLVEFARVGASALVAQTRLSPDSADAGWVAHDYIGWVKRLPPP